MNPELQEKLFNKYPKLFIKNKPATKPFDQWGIECWDGWFNILDNLCEYIQNYINNNKYEQIRFTQIKQKLSTLRIYHEPYNEKIQPAINYAEFLSSKVCEKCGALENVSRNSKGYILTLCDKCRKDNKD